jgi:hypothetical protein
VFSLKFAPAINRPIVVGGNCFLYRGEGKKTELEEKGKKRKENFLDSSSKAFTIELSVVSSLVSASRKIETPKSLWRKTPLAKAQTSESA